MTANVAVFDLDGTIMNGDTYVLYLLHVLRHRPYRIVQCAGLPVVALRFGLGLASNDEVKQKFLHAIAGGSTRRDVERYTNAFAGPCLRLMAKRVALERISMHARRGDTLIMATAGLDLYARALGERLGFHHIVATQPAWTADRLGFGLDGPNLRGEEKVLAVRRVVAGLGLERPHVIAYSDHHSDLPLLQFADEAYAIDPTPRLAKAVAGLAIPIERWVG